MLATMRAVSAWSPSVMKTLPPSPIAGMSTTCNAFWSGELNDFAFFNPAHADQYLERAVLVCHWKYLFVVLLQ
jgi:hypothetical protein